MSNRCAVRGFFCGLLLAGAARAGEGTNGYFDRLRSSDPNYFAVAIPVDNGRFDDDLHVEFSLALEYPVGLWTNTNLWLPDRLLPEYNGLYDFYMFPGGRYESAPVISRRQNPGLALEWDLHGSNWLRLGYFHESNGQTLDEEDGEEAYRQEAEQGGEEHALSQVSRGWDYVCARYRREGAFAWGKDCFWNAYAELRWFTPRQGAGSERREDSLFWEPNGHRSHIEDYDGLRLMFETTCKQLPVLGRSSGRVELKTGTGDIEALGRIGGRISLTFLEFVNVFYFNGYGKEPSTYHLRTEYVGVALEFR